MKKNYYEEVAKMFGVELEEEFKISNCANIKFKFTKNGLMACDNRKDKWYLGLYTFYSLLRGECEIIKKTFKPKTKELYYWVTIYQEVVTDTWIGTQSDYTRYALGNCFKTIEEAELHKEEIIKKIKEPYEKN